MNFATPTPEEGPEGLPLFASNQATFSYRVNYNHRGRYMTIRYSTVHELILNLQSFKDTDSITYLERPDLKEFITITVDDFKVSISKTLYDAPRERLEVLYQRLILTNHYSKHISDKGTFWQYDLALRKYISTIRGGIDWYLSLENSRTILYVKCRRLSPVFLLSYLANINQSEDIHVNHINIPRQLDNNGLLPQTLRVHLRRSQFKLYSYDPISGAENDPIVPTDMSDVIIKVVNQFLKS